MGSLKYPGPQIKFLPNKPKPRETWNKGELVSAHSHVTFGKHFRSYLLHSPLSSNNTLKYHFILITLISTVTNLYPNSFLN